MKNAISPPKFAVYDTHNRLILGVCCTFAQACKLQLVYTNTRKVEIYHNPAWVSAKPGREHQ